MLGVLARLISILADLSTLVTVMVGLLFIDKIIAFSSLLIYGTIGLILYLFFRRKARISGNLQTEYTVRSNQEVYEVLGCYRETYVKNRRSYYAEKISQTRLALSDTQAKIGFMNTYSKYVMDLSVTLGSLIIAILQFHFVGGTQAIASLGLFLAAGTRLAPAILRMQQNGVEVMASIAASEDTFDLYEKLSDSPYAMPSNQDLNYDYSGFAATIKMNDVSFSYPGNENKTLDRVSLEIEEGNFCAITGDSGAGKTTLVDVMLGVIKPQSGDVYISGGEPQRTIEKWAGAIGYVPQDVLIVEGTIRENVTLGYPSQSTSDDDIWRALETAKLIDYVKSQPLGLNTFVGDRGTKLSGGQRQRLGIARAMFTNPKLLILDEATSALDLTTESEFTATLKSLKGKVTIVVIAHRISTIEPANLVYKIENGQVVKK
jgi:ABC-type multidrug transport system fused ATPase/permease subunit